MSYDPDPFHYEGAKLSVELAGKVAFLFSVAVVLAYAAFRVLG